jgi:uncharacterized radical SAM protein YgiQ
MNPNNHPQFLPTSKDEIQSLGWQQADIILFTGDAYVDHPAFGAAVIGRMLESAGYKIAIVPQPNWQDDLRDFKKLGRPNICFAVTAGNMDSMINHYTASRRKRHDDAYTPGNRHGARPDYPSIVYTKILKSLYPDIPVVLGGIEASLRRFTHYDYWQNKLLPGILHSSKADFLIYGMGEYPVIQLINAISNHTLSEQISDIPNLQYKAKEIPSIEKFEILAPHEICLHDKEAFGQNFVRIEQNANSLEPHHLIQACGTDYLITNPALHILTRKKIDKIYDLGFTRVPHPRYQNKAPIPAYEMIRHSINIHRGCFGACSFCTIAAHQGRFVSSRSESSVLKELQKVTQMPDFKGHVTDLGGPSANMYGMHPIDLNRCRKCKRASCIYPSICDNLNTDHTSLLQLYQKAQNHPAVKKISIGSGIRYDLILQSSEKYRAVAGSYLEQLIRFHVSGRLKVAPEHTEDKVLKVMRKPSFKLYQELEKTFNKINQRHQLNQQLIPYFISGHPGCEIKDMKILAEKVRQMNIITDQSQDFTPTPMTLSTVIFYTGKNPYNGEILYTAKTSKEKQEQRNTLLPYQKAHKKSQTHTKKASSSNIRNKKNRNKTR